MRLLVYSATALLLGLSSPSVLADKRSPRSRHAQARPVEPRPEDVVARALKQTVVVEGDGVYGSGILLVPRQGLIVTNFHVIDHVKRLRVRLFDGREAAAQVIEVDPTLDLALLQGPPVDAPAPVLGNALDLRAAQPIYAIGAPRRLGFTVSRGIVSYVGRTMEGTRYIQTDVAINDGNSGGPVITTHGEIVGIMSFILKRAQGLAFALPMNYAIERFADRLPPDRGRRAYLDRFKQWKVKEPSSTSVTDKAGAASYR